MVLQWIATGSVRAHSKAVSALCVLDGCLASGGSDASVKIWNISADDCSGTKYDIWLTKTWCKQICCKNSKFFRCREDILSRLLYLNSLNPKVGLDSSI